jgi:hypothetical protein
LAKARASGDRISAAALVITGCVHAWRYPEWWSGLPDVLLKLAAPRPQPGAYARPVSPR